MTDDEWTNDEVAALHWLQTGKGPGLAALIRLLEDPLLKGAPPLNQDILNVLAGALCPAGVSEMKLTLERRRGRGRPSTFVKNAVEAAEMAARIDEGKAAGIKQESLLEGEPGSHGKKYAQLRAGRRIRYRK
jgi:hypothetical protein